MPEWLNSIVGILLVVFFFGFSVFIHEFGHLLAAVWRGLHVEKFSIGFGHRIWGFKKNGIDFIIGWLPFGGYVALPQLEPNDEPTTSGGKLLPQPKPIDKIIVAVAGPLFNLMFAFVLGVILWKAGTPVGAPVEHLDVIDLPAKSVEYKAGLRNGDKIIKVNGQSVKSIDFFIKEYVLSTKKLVLDIERAGEEIKIGPFKPEFDSDIENLAYPPFSFRAKSKPQKAVVNFVPEYSKDKSIKYPAKPAGVLAGDRFIKVDGIPVEYEREVSRAINAKKGEPVNFTLLRGDKEVELTIKPKKDTQYLIGLRFKNFPKVFDAALELSAYKAGIRKWDNLLQVNGKDVVSKEDLVDILTKEKGKEIEVKIDRDGQEIVFPVKVQHDSYFIGVRWQSFKVYLTPYQQFDRVFSETFRTIKALVSGQVPLGGLSGPWGISKGIYNSWQYLGIIGVLSFIFMINISLAVFNLLPLPVLDGGHIFVAAAELISRRKIPAKILQPVTLVFILLFFSLMIYVTLNDAKRGDDWTKYVQVVPQEIQPRT